jgi:hypothetical protein
MRAFILITAMVLASATAQAGERSLSVSGSDTSAATAPAGSASAQVSETPKASETAAPAETTGDAPAASETPKYVERPALVEPKGEPSNAQPSKPVAAKTASVPKPRRTAHKGYWTEGRIIGELHRHGIYW